MVSQKHRGSSQIEPVPADIESARAKLVYIALDAFDGATVDELSAMLATKKITVLSVLRSLSSAGHVDRAGSEYVAN